MALLTRTLYALALQAALLAGPVWANAPLRPGKLAKTAVVWAKTDDGARAAAVDDKRYVWLGKSTLSKALAERLGYHLYLEPVVSSASACDTRLSVPS